MHRMNVRSLQLAVVVLGLGFAFLLGQRFAAGDGPGGTGLDFDGVLAAQDRGGPPPRRQPDPTPPTTTEPRNDVLVYGESGGVAASANGFLAVTGSYGVGTSVLYLIDTNSRQMAVYEARGGSRSMRRLMLVGARRIDLDLQLEGYNDESEFDYQALRRKFDGGEARSPEGDFGLRGSDEEPRRRD